MKINIKVHARSKRESITPLPDGSYKVDVKVMACDVIDLLECGVIHKPVIVISEKDPCACSHDNAVVTGKSVESETDCVCPGPVGFGD